MATALTRQDIQQWAASQEIALIRGTLEQQHPQGINLQVHSLSCCFHTDMDANKTSQP
jgi:hypothetical protein